MTRDGFKRREETVRGVGVGGSQLYELQQIDTALTRAMAHRQGLDDGTTQRAALAAATAHLAEIQRQRTDSQSRLRVLDLEIQSLQAKRTRVNMDLYSGRIGNPKELAAMQEEVAAFDRRKAALEDEVLALLEQVDQLDAQIREGQQAREAGAAALARQEGLFRETAAAADREISDLTARRAALVASIDDDLMRRYDRLREHKGGIAVVMVRGGICDGCHMAIPARLVTRLENDPDLLAACDDCGRLLVVR